MSEHIRETLAADSIHSRAQGVIASLTTGQLMLPYASITGHFTREKNLNLCLLSLKHTVSWLKRHKDKPLTLRQAIKGHNMTIFTLKQVTDDGQCNYSWVWEGVFACSFMEQDYGY